MTGERAGAPPRRPAPRVTGHVAWAPAAHCCSSSARVPVPHNHQLLRHMLPLTEVVRGEKEARPVACSASSADALIWFFSPL